jgi:hypothetical protein
METDEEQPAIMAETEEGARKNETVEKTMDAADRRSAEEYWYPNKVKSDPEALRAGDYHAYRPWKNDEISKRPPNCIYFYSNE